MIFVVIILAVLCLAYANGANDNLKGVATLLGSGTTNYRGAVVWATVTTLLGSLTAVFLAGTLLKSFSGKGLVADHLVADPSYGAAVALGAGLTVLLATRLGMPISTTHSLVGALVGAGWAAGSTIDVARLGQGFFVPLLLSPPLAILATIVCYVTFRGARRGLGISEQTCFCVGNQVIETVPVLNNGAAFQRVEQLSVSLGDSVTCQNRYQGKLLGIEAAALLDRLHYLSSGMVCYARGLNDTPKIAAVLLLARLSGFGSTALVGLAIACGGVLGARKVAETMSQKITSMNHGQGFAANLVTGLIVIGASRLGLPVSTTHVSCGSLFGIGAVTGQGHRSMIGKILGAWVITLPVAAVWGAIGYWFLKQV